MRKLTSFLAAILSFVVCLGGVSPALAQQAPQPPSRGITTLYVTPEQQAQGVDVYGNILKYDVAIPNPDLSAMLPENLSDFPAAYQPILEQGRKNNGTNGSFTEGWFDFQAASAVTPGTNTLFTIDAPLNGRIYTVVAGKPSSQCPLKIEETAIAFFDNVGAAESKANELDANGYLVYVSPSDNLTIKAFSQLFYDQATGKKKTNSACFLVSGATEKVTTDFQQIFPLLPRQLQQPARQAPFQYFPRTGNFIYLVNARKTLKEDTVIRNVDFLVNVISGSLKGKQFKGSFTYNPLLLKGKGQETINVLSAEFNYLSKYTETPNISFTDGNFERLIWVSGKSTERFGFNAGFRREQFGRPEEAFIRNGKDYFAYLNAGTFVDGAGTITYTTR
jgi:hypothetical protein